MASFNRVILMGNFTRNPELRFTPAGKPLCEFTLAVNKTWTDAAGQKQEKVGFFGCVSWGRQAETIARLFSQGRPILIEGELTQETWEDPTTQKRKEKTKILVERFTFVDGRKEGSPTQPAQAQPERPPQAPARPPVAIDLDNAAEDDIPF